MASPQANITKRGSNWVFHISDFNWDADMFVDSELHTTCIEWTTAYLADKPDVTRMSYDQWYFKRKRDAEEFRTFWLIKWS